MPKKPAPRPLAARVRDSSLRRREAERTSVREAIFAAAEALLLENGYEGFSLRQVAERIGYTPTTIYRYFADRDALLYALTEAGFQEFGRRLAAAAEERSDAGAVLGAIGRAYVQFGLDHPVEYRLMFLQRTDYLEKPSADTDGSRIDSFGVLQAAVARTIGPRGIDGAQAAAIADALWAAVHGVVTLAITMPRFDADRIARMTDEMLALIERGLQS
jgi:AcrR family transcriptional regulator